MRALSRRINRLFEQSRYRETERILRRELARSPQDHGLLSRLSSAVYEQRRYREALKLARAAEREAPFCPMVLWDVAGALHMLGRGREAEAIWRRLIRRGVESLARGECNEGLADARTTVASCWFRIAARALEHGKHVAASRALAAMKRQRARTIYDRDVVALLARIEARRA